MTNKEDQDLTIFLNENLFRKEDKHPHWKYDKRLPDGSFDKGLAWAWNGVSKGKDGKPDRKYIKVGLSVALVKELYEKIAKPTPQESNDYVNPDDFPF